MRNGIINWKRSENMIEDKLLTISYKFRQSKLWEYWQPGQVFVLDLPGGDSAVVRLDLSLIHI